MNDLSRCSSEVERQHRMLEVSSFNSETAAPSWKFEDGAPAKTVIGALQYAGGNLLYRLPNRGCLDASKILRRFACDCALSVSDLWDCPQVVKSYLGSADPQYREIAHKAAWYVAWSATQKQAWEGAAAHAGNAAISATIAVAHMAALDAAWNAARALAHLAGPSMGPDYIIAMGAVVGEQRNELEHAANDLLAP